jgi:hypothetical protein
MAIDKYVQMHKLFANAKKKKKEGYLHYCIAIHNSTFQ